MNQSYQKKDMIFSKHLYFQHYHKIEYTRLLPYSAFRTYDTYIDNTRNNKLIKLLLFIKPTNTSDLITNIDMDDTFKIKSTKPGEENAIIESTIRLFNNNINANLKPFNLSNIYQY
jgi:hypothetical protein